MLRLKSESCTISIFEFRIDPNNLDIEWIIICSKFSFGKKGFKYFVGCKDDGKVGALYIKLPQMSGHAKRFDKTRHVSSN